MLVHRLRRWPNIKTALFQSVVFTGYRARVWHVHVSQISRGSTLTKIVTSKEVHILH